MLAATVMSHGAVFRTVCGAGPRFMPANTTGTPLATACSVPANSWNPPQRERQHVDAVVGGVVYGRQERGAAAPDRRAPARLVDGQPGAGRAAARHPGGEPAAVVAHVPHGAPGDRRGHVRPVAVVVPGRHELPPEQLGVHAAGVPPRADDLPVAARRVERLAGVALAFPPCGHGAVSTVVEAL